MESNSPKELRENALADLPSCPRSVLKYLEHISANKVHVALGNLEMSHRDTDHEKTVARVSQAEKAIRELWKEIKMMTAEVK
jgi:hypothetical protein